MLNFELFLEKNLIISFNLEFKNLKKSKHFDFFKFDNNYDDLKTLIENNDYISIIIVSESNTEIENILNFIYKYQIFTIALLEDNLEIQNLKNKINSIFFSKKDLFLEKFTILFNIINSIFSNDGILNLKFHELKEIFYKKENLNLIYKFGKKNKLPNLLDELGSYQIENIFLNIYLNENFSLSFIQDLVNYLDKTLNENLDLFYYNLIVDKNLSDEDFYLNILISS